MKEIYMTKAGLTTLQTALWRRKINSDTGTPYDRTSQEQRRPMMEFIRVDEIEMHVAGINNVIDNRY